MHLHPQRKLCSWEKEGTDLSGLRSVPSALPGDGGGAALCPKCFLQHTAHCTRAHTSPLPQGLTPLSCLSFPHTCSSLRGGGQR